MNDRIGALYIRVSTDDQAELSPDAQKRLLLDYAKKNGIIISCNSNIVKNCSISLLDFIQFPPFTHISTLAAYRISVRAIMLRVFIPHVFSFFCGCILLLTG